MLVPKRWAKSALMKTEMSKTELTKTKTGRLVPHTQPRRRLRRRLRSMMRPRLSRKRGWAKLTSPRNRSLRLRPIRTKRWSKYPRRRRANPSRAGRLTRRNQTTSSIHRSWSRRNWRSVSAERLARAQHRGRRGRRLARPRARLASDRQVPHVGPMWQARLQSPTRLLPPSLCPGRKRGRTRDRKQKKICQFAAALFL